MEAIRHIVTPSTNHLEITLPDHLVHEQLDVIILAMNDTRNTETGYKSLKGAISESEARKMLEHIESSRNDWE